jgi:hypothetical protein
LPDDVLAKYGPLVFERFLRAIRHGEKWANPFQALRLQKWDERRLIERACGLMTNWAASRRAEWPADWGVIPPSQRPPPPFSLRRPTWADISA